MSGGLFVNALLGLLSGGYGQDELERGGGYSAASRLTGRVA